jgi:hypothetical protein
MKVMALLVSGVKQVSSASLGCIEQDIATRVLFPK